MTNPAPTATIAGLNHDLKARRSFVVLVWDDEPGKHLSLPVPFGCLLDNLPAEAQKALNALSAETAALVLRSVD